MLTILQLLKWLNGVLPNKQLDSKAIDYLGQILLDISSSNEFKDDHKSKQKLYVKKRALILGKTEVKLEKLIEHLPVSGLAITKEELVQIQRALGGHVTKFYKCSKGNSKYVSSSICVGMDCSGC